MASLSQIDIVDVIGCAIGICGLAQPVSRDQAGHGKNGFDHFPASKSLPW